MKNNYQNLINVLGWCNPEYGLAYEEYIIQMNRAIDNEFVDRADFIHAAESAIKKPDFDWSELLRASGALSTEYDSDILSSPKKSRDYALEYLEPVLHFQRSKDNPS